MVQEMKYERGRNYRGRGKEKKKSNKRIRRAGKILTIFMELRSKKSWEKTA